MKKTFYIWQREMTGLFSSPVGYVAIAALTAINSWFFWIIIQLAPFSTMQMEFSNMCVVMMFFIPAFTMRQLAEEKKSGTSQLLFTSPLTDVQIVLGKYLGALTLYTLALVVSFVYPAFLYTYGSPDLGPILSGYLGLFLLGGCYLSMGLFVSSLTESQVVAFLGSMGALLILFFIDASVRVPSQWYEHVLQYLSLNRHYSEFSRGLIELKSVVFYLSFISFFLFLTVRSVESRKWR